MLLQNIQLWTICLVETTPLGHAFGIDPTDLFDPKARVFLYMFHHFPLIFPNISHANNSGNCATPCRSYRNQSSSQGKVHRGWTCHNRAESGRCVTQDLAPELLLNHLVCRLRCWLEKKMPPGGPTAVSGFNQGNTSRNHITWYLAQ